jgi:hypothetical protein
MAGADTYGTLGSGLGVIATAVTPSGGADADAGTYIIDDSDVVVSAGAGQDGTGATFEVIVSALGAVSVNVVNGGSGYDAGNTITIPQALISEATSDISFTITLDGGSAGAFSRTTNPDANSPYGALVGLPTDTNHSINFGQSNRAVLATCNLYFVMETSTTNPMVYKMENAQINEASIDFEVDGIATINWSGFAKNILDLQSTKKTSGNNDAVVVGTGTAPQQVAGSIYLQSDADFAFTLYPGTFDPEATTDITGVAAIDDGVDSTKTFIRNRITQMQVSTTDTAAYGSGEYDLTLTGGNITVSNNITYLVPEELGAVNVPIEGVTGGRTVTGSFTCYLTLDTAGADRGTSVDLFNDMTTPGKGLDKVVNDFQVTFQVGGGVAGTPRLYVTCPKVHIEVPTHSIEDVISVETGFGAYTEDFDKADEFTLTYFGIAP